MTEKNSLEKYLKSIMEKLDTQEKIIRSLEEKLSRFERPIYEREETVSLPPALLRVLKCLANEEKPLGTEEVAKKINLSRNLTSNYLKRLSDLGYVIKEPNLEGSGPRYLFRVDFESIPDSLKKLLSIKGL